MLNDKLISSLLLLTVLYNVFRKAVEYYRGNKSLPVYERPAKGYSAEEIPMILCNPILDEILICSTHPVSVQNNVSFVVNLSKLKNHNDIRTDDLGTWTCTGLSILKFTVKCNEKRCRLVDTSCKEAIVINVR